MPSHQRYPKVQHGALPQPVKTIFRHRGHVYAVEWTIYMASRMWFGLLHFDKPNGLYAEILTDMDTGRTTATLYKRNEWAGKTESESQAPTIKTALEMARYLRWIPSKKGG